MADQLEDLLRACVVQVRGTELGAGFFIAPGKVLTCAHVVGDSAELRIRWERDGQPAAEANVSGRVVLPARHGWPIPVLDEYPDIAVLDVDGLEGHPCVRIDTAWPSLGDSFQVYGYPREGRAIQLTPGWLTYRGIHGTAPTAYLDLASDTIKPGMSGAPVLNLRTGGICGVIVASKDPARPDGALAVPWAAIEADLAEVLAANQAFHLSDRRWVAGAATAATASDTLLRDIAPSALSGRGEELQYLARRGTDGSPYSLLLGDPWAGKTALTSWFALHPPARVRVVAFFIAQRLGGEADYRALAADVTEQLCLLCNEEYVQVMRSGNLRGQFLRLLTEAARRTQAAGERLVLVIDGLDEDTGIGRGMPSIASYLPRQEIPGLHVIVSSRRNADLPRDLPEDHPLRSCETRTLAPSPYAIGIRQAAEAELGSLLGEGGAEYDVLGFLAACGGGLTCPELAEICGVKTGVMRGWLASKFRRVLAVRTRIKLLGTSSLEDTREYVFAHGELFREAQEQITSRELGIYRAKIHSWADACRDSGWNEATPGFFWLSYAEMLAAVRDRSRLATLATDPRRHDQMLRRIGGDVVGMTEIDAAHEYLALDPEPNLGALALLAAERDRLFRRNTHVTPDLPLLWALLGEADRAEALADSLSSPHSRVATLAKIAEISIQLQDDERACRIADKTGEIAQSIPVPYRQLPGFLIISHESAIHPGQPVELRTAADLAVTVASLAQAMVTIDPARTRRLAELAELLAGSLIDQHWAEGGWRAASMAGIARAIADDSLDLAEELAHCLAERSEEANALCDIAESISGSDPVRSARILRAAQNLTRLMGDAHEQAETMSRLASAWEALDHDSAATAARKAASLACSLGDSCIRSLRLAAVSGGLRSAARSATDEDEEYTRHLAEVLEDHADDLAEHPLSFFSVQTEILADVSSVLAAADTDKAIEAANGLGHPGARATALAGVVRVTADRPARQVRELAEASESLAHQVDEPYERSLVLSEIAGALLRPGAAPAARRLIAEAEALALSVPSMIQRAVALAGAAAALEVLAAEDGPAAGGPKDVHAASHDDAYQRSAALAERAQETCESHPARARELVESAEEVARQVTDPGRLAPLLARIADAALNASDPGKAKDLAYQAFQLAGELAEPYERSSVAADALEVIVDVDFVAAGLLAPMAEEDARQLADLDQRVEVLARLAKVLADVSLADHDYAKEPDYWPAVDAVTSALAETLSGTPADGTSPGERYATGSCAGLATRLLSRAVTMLVQAAWLLREHDPASADELCVKAAEFATVLADEEEQAAALAGLAAGIGEHDPVRASRLLAEAEALARNATDLSSRADALVSIALPLAGTNPARATSLAREAEALCHRIEHPYWSRQPLLYLARGLAHFEADQAVQIARGLADREAQIQLLADISEVIASADAGHAIGLLQPIAEATVGATGLEAGDLKEILAHSLAKTDPAAAADFVRAAADDEQRALLLALVACAVAPVDPARARELAREADSIRTGRFDFFSVSTGSEARDLSGTARMLANRDIPGADARATRLFGSTHVMSRLHPQNHVLSDIGRFLAENDADRARDLFRSVLYQSQVLSGGPDPARLAAEIVSAMVDADRDEGRRLLVELLGTSYWYAALPALGKLQPAAVAGLVGYWREWRRPA